MSPQRQFEGPDVRTLLDEICATYGPEPTIAKAESFRTGGVLGFFQKEHYRLVVDGDPAQPVDAEPKEKTLIYQAPPRPDGRPSRGRHFAGASRTSMGSHAVGSGVDSPTAEFLALSAYSALSAPGAESEDPFASLADDTEDAFVSATPRVDELAPAADPVPDAPARPQEPSFESVLRRVADFVDEPRAEPITWPSARDWHPATPEPSRPATESQPRAPEPTTPVVAVHPAAPVPGSAAPAVAEVGADLFTEQSTPEPPATADRAAHEPPAQEKASTAAPEADPMAGPAVEELGPVAELGPVEELQPAEEHHAGVPELPGDIEDVRADPEPDLDESLPHSHLTAEAASLRLALHRVGFDPEMVERIEAATAYPDVEDALVEVFESLVPAPRLPRRPGSLIVVVGTGRRAAAEARRIAGEVGSDPAAVAYATERRLPWPVSDELIVRSVEDAHELAPGHRRGRVGVVAVDVPVGSLGTNWAANVVHALRPSLVVGVVDAMYKNEDIGDWTERLGGVDSLLVDNLDCTVSPARVLSLEIPVSRIDDSPATPTRWAATVLDRLAPGDEDDDEGTEAVGRHFAGRRSSC